MSSVVNPLCDRSFRTAPIGPSPIVAGSQPVDRTSRRYTAFVVDMPSGAASSPSTSMDDAPSLIPDALPAVTVPSFLNAGRSFDSPSEVVSGLGYSSSSMTVSALREITVTGVISFLNTFPSDAATAFS